MDKHGLMKAMRQDGGVVSVVGTKKEWKTAKENPYSALNDDAVKEWYVHQQAATVDKVEREYLLLLLTSAEHKFPVTHFAGVNVYKAVLGPSSKPNVRGSKTDRWIRSVEIGEAWGDPDVEENVRPAKKARAKAKAKRINLRDVRGAIGK